MNKLAASPLQHEQHQSPAHQPHVPYESNPFTVLIQGTEKLFRTNQAAAIILLVISVLMAVFQFFADIVRLLIESASSSNSSSSHTQSVLGANTSSGAESAGIIAVVLIVLGVIFIAIAVSAVYQVFYRGMVAYVVLCTIQNKKANFAEGFSLVLKKFWRLLLGSALAQLKIIGGFLLLIVPGIRAAQRYSMLDIYILDKEVGVMQAHRNIKQITQGRLLEIFSANTFASWVPLAGPVVVIGGQIKQYDQLVRTYEQQQARPNVHWLNWLPLILLAALLVFILFIIGVIALVALSK